jgi:hypothetical protein
MTRAQARAERKRLWREIEREQKRAARERLRSLREAIRTARRRRTEALRDAKARCKAERIAARARARELRRRLLEELRAAVKAERQAARSTCSAGLRDARAIGDEIGRAARDFGAERTYQRDLKRIEAYNRQRRREVVRTTARERRHESDDEVRSNISAELVPLWGRVRQKIRGSARMSRTEAFLKYAEEHPAEVLEGLDAKTDAVIAHLERQQREARRDVRRRIPRAELASLEAARPGGMSQSQGAPPDDPWGGLLD